MIFLALLSLCHVHPLYFPLSSTVHSLRSLVSGFIILCPSCGLNFVHSLGLYTLGTSVEFGRSRSTFLLCDFDPLGLQGSPSVFFTLPTFFFLLESESELFKDSVTTQ